MTVLYIIIGAIVLLALFLMVLSFFCFDDNDPDMDWYDNYTTIQCPHIEKTDVIVNATVTCEEVWTVCDNCSEVLNKRTDC